MRKNQNILPTSFGIFGTCDSVDVFEFTPKTNLISKVPMRAGSILTACDSRTRKNFGDLYHSSSLAAMLLKTILDGQVMDFVRDNTGEFLIIDLTEDRKWNLLRSAI